MHLNCNFTCWNKHHVQGHIEGNEATTTCGRPGNSSARGGSGITLRHRTSNGCGRVMPMLVTLMQKHKSVLVDGPGYSHPPPKFNHSYFPPIFSIPKTNGMITIGLICGYCSVVGSPDVHTNEVLHYIYSFW